MDADDYFWLSTLKWYAVKGGSTFYAVRGINTKEGKKRQLFMHREVLKVAVGMFVDHINHNGLDNRKANLRPATTAQNIRNRKKHFVRSGSRYKGLYWDNRRKQWRVRICFNGTRINLGSFDDEIEAAKAFDRGAIKYHGRFASLNFPE